MNITNKHYKIYRMLAMAFVVVLSLGIAVIALAMPVGTYDQCSNDQGTGYTSGDTGCRWINGNLQQSNSLYNEGDATV